MPYRYPLEFRRRVLDLLAAGRSVASLLRDLGVSDQTIYNWRRQDLIDRGLEPGSTSEEQAELHAAFIEVPHRTVASPGFVGCCRAAADGIPIPVTTGVSRPSIRCPDRGQGCRGLG